LLQVLTHVDVSTVQVYFVLIRFFRLYEQYTHWKEAKS